jgi:transposase
MNSGKTIFSQFIEQLPQREFSKCVARYNGNYRTRSFSCWDQFLCMGFAQLAGLDSLGDTVSCLRSRGEKLYHLGIRGHVSKSTLAKANELRDWRIYEDFALHVIGVARKLYAGETWGENLKRSVYAFDSSTIDLCLTLFPWAKFRRHKAAVKLHTLLDVVSQIPTVIHVTNGKVHDVNLLDELVYEPGATYLMDRGYIDYQRLYRLHCDKAFFVTRAKKNAKFRRLESRPVNMAAGIIRDQIVRLANPSMAKCYPECLRRIVYIDPENGKRLVFLTNHFELSAETIAALYRSRWKVELFFKWVKQNLRIKAFYGTTENAVKTQIWIAITMYVLAAVIKRRMNLEAPLSQILLIFRTSLFEKTPLSEILYGNELLKKENEHCKPLPLLDF